MPNQMRPRRTQDSGKNSPVQTSATADAGTGGSSEVGEEDFFGWKRLLVSFSVFFVLNRGHFQHLITCQVDLYEGLSDIDDIYQ